MRVCANCGELVPEGLETVDACPRVENGPHIFLPDDLVEEPEVLYETDSAASLEAASMAALTPVEHYDGDPTVEHRDIRTMHAHDMPQTLDEVAGHDPEKENGKA